MAAWKEIATRLAADAESHFDRLKYRLAGLLDDNDPINIVPYRYYGTAERLHLIGRVLEHADRYMADANDTVWRNLLNAYRRFESDEVPGALVRASFGGVSADVTTDDEGYFEVTLEPPTPAAPGAWHEVALELLAPVPQDGTQAKATGRVLVPSEEAAFGIISDIDDTVLKTNATSLRQMAQLTFLHNAHTRKPFHGVAAFYRALVRGTPEHAINPIFYVSSSPWNLYDLLVDFMRLNDIPAGPLLLRDLGLDPNKFIKAGHHDHKREQIEGVLRTYPSLPFILIGDSGQHDTAIYLDVLRHYPERIRGIYIRDVTDEVRDAELRALIEAAAPGVEVLLVQDSFEAARHAAAEGFITAEALGPILEEKEADERAPDPVEQLLSPGDEVTR